MMVRREARSKGCELVYARPRRPTDGQEAVTGNKEGDLGGVHGGGRDGSSNTRPVGAAWSRPTTRASTRPTLRCCSRPDNTSSARPPGKQQEEDGGGMI
jgi:hypothetical protein